MQHLSRHFYPTNGNSLKAAIAAVAKMPTITPEAHGNGRQPWGNHGAQRFYQHFSRTVSIALKYGGKHDDLAPFVINQHRNGLLTPWGIS